MPKSRWFIVLPSVLLALLLFKPVTVFIFEYYLSSLLETEVEVDSFDVLELQIQASIKEESNIANVKIFSLYPLQADIKYEGNADAFKVYHPLKAMTSLQGQLYYNGALKVDARLNALGAKIDVEVKEGVQGWDVLLEADDLDLAQLKDENNLPFELSGIVDGNIDFHTAADSTVQITSNALTIKNQKIKDFILQLSRAERNLYAWALFDAEDIEYRGVWFHYDQNTTGFEGQVDLRHKAYNQELIINLEGEHNASALLAHADIGIENSHIDISDIVYDINRGDTRADLKIDINEIQKHRHLLTLLGLPLQGDVLAKAALDYKDKRLKADVDLQSLGAKLLLEHRDGHLQWKMQKLELSKLLSLIGKEEKFKAKIDSRGSFYKNRLDASVDAKHLSIEQNEIKNIQLSAKGPVDELEITLHAQSPYVTIEDSKVSIKDLSALELDAKVSTPYIADVIALKANALHSDAGNTFALKMISNAFDFVVPQANYRDSKLSGTIKSIIKPELSSLKESLHLDGNFSFDKVFKVEMESKDFGGELKASLIDKNIKVKGSSINLEKVLADLDQPTYARGEVDLEAQGTPEKMYFSVNSKHVGLIKQETGIDENLSADIEGEWSKDELILRPVLTNRYLDAGKGKIIIEFADKRLKADVPITIKKEKQKLELVTDTDVRFQDGIRAALSIGHQEDRFRLERLIYKDKKLKTDIKIDIKDLNNYKTISGENLYGPLIMAGKAVYEKNSPTLLLTSDTFDGELSVSLKDNNLIIDLDRLSAVKISGLLHEERRVQQGYLNGNVSYDLVKETGWTKLDAKAIKVQGIDIDSELKGLEDILGLNIFAFGDKLYSRTLKGANMNKHTAIKHMKLDLIITPEFVISKDLAMSTETYRFAINASVKHDGGIKAFEVAVLDRQGCPVIRQKLKGNIASPELVNSTGTAVILLGSAPKSVLKTGGKILDFGASVIDNSANFIWQKALRQDSKVTLIQDTMTEGYNVLSSGKDIIVSGECNVFYDGEVKHPQ